jgi:eukaryotic-like serine/threonine-protein kinase
MNKADRWKTIEELFYRALEVPEAERASFIESNADGDNDIVREVQSLIDSDSAAATGSYAAAAVKKALVNFHNAENAATAPGRKVGRYRLIKEIGRGGMGTVYLATRDDDTYLQNVAIKLVRRGMDTDFILARFRRERQILASLEHPNIARLLDGGATEDGLPYLVMEYVKGVSIAEYAEQNDLTVEQRLRLFLQICDAVEYAHRNFIVHRDLKPGNILVDEKGAPKLLDFGISKLLVYDGANTTATITHDVRMLTPDYASPEQIRGEAITSAADVYSLGAVLFELLTGAKPHRIDKPTQQAVEYAICEVEIQKPSDAARAAGRPVIARKLQGDLDNILLLAMRKESRRRYASVHDFAADIRRYLDFLPVSARPDSLVYRSKKFLRRNWGPLAAVGAVILVLLAGVLVARREARIARTHFDQVRRLANTFVTSVHDEIRNLPGSTRARQMIVKTGLEYLETLAASSQGDIDLQREVGAGYMRIGDVQGSVLEANLGDTKGALASYTKALKLLENVARERPGALDVQNDILIIHRRIGEIYGYTKSTEAALQSYANARAVGEALLARAPNDERLRRSIADLYQAQGRTLRFAEDISGALVASDRALDLYRSLAEKSPDDLNLRQDEADALTNSGMALARLARRDEAIANFQNAVRDFELLVAREPQNAKWRRGLMLAYSHVGDILSELGVAKPSELPGALKAYIQMYETARQLHRADPANFRALTDIGIAAMRVGRITPKEDDRLKKFEESLGFLRQASQTHKDLMIDMNTAFTQTRIGEILRGRGDIKGSRRYFEEAVVTGERLLSVNPKNSSVRRTLIEGLRSLGEDAAGRRDRREAIECREKLIRYADEVRSHDATPRVQALIAKGYAGAAAIDAALGDRKRAREWYGRSLAEYRRLQDQATFSSRKEMQETQSAFVRLR